MMTDVQDELARGNRIMDEAAMAVGRDPRQVRRLFDFVCIFGPAGRGFLQGLPQQWVEELLPLAIERWGGEVAPALREAVAHERGSSDGERSSPQR